MFTNFLPFDPKSEAAAFQWLLNPVSIRSVTLKAVSWWPWLRTDSAAPNICFQCCLILVICHKIANQFSLEQFSLGCWPGRSSSLNLIWCKKVSSTMERFRIKWIYFECKEWIWQGQTPVSVCVRTTDMQNVGPWAGGTVSALLKKDLCLFCIRTN